MSLAQTQTVRDVSKLVGVSVDILKRRSKSGKFIRPITVDGQHWRFSTNDVNAWLNASSKVGKAQHELLTGLELISRDDNETLQGRRWAAEKLGLLREGLISFDDVRLP